MNGGNWYEKYLTCVLVGVFFVVLVLGFFILCYLSDW